MTLKIKQYFKEYKQWDIVKNKGRYLLLLPALIFIIVFAYIPMVGIVIAFQEYDPMQGFFGSPWTGINNFRFFFVGTGWIQVTLNTLYLNFLFIITGTIFSVGLAVVFSELKNKVFTKVSQTFLTLPNFISWATVALFSVVFLESDGIVNNIITFFGGDPVSFYSNPDVWPVIFVIIRAWKGSGWGAIVYMAAIAGIDKEMYEAAKIDGASKFQSIIKITLPMIADTVILMTILGIGNIFRGDFGMIYPFVGDNSALFPTTDVIDTYVFRALRSFTNYGRSAAVSLYQSVIGFILVIITNKLAKRYAPGGALF